MWKLLALLGNNKENNEYKQIPLQKKDHGGLVFQVWIRRPFLQKKWVSFTLFCSKAKEWVDCGIALSEK